MNCKFSEMCSTTDFSLGSTAVLILFNQANDPFKSRPRLIKIFYSPENISQKKLENCHLLSLTRDKVVSRQTKSLLKKLTTVKGWILRTWWTKFGNFRNQVCENLTMKHALGPSWSGKASFKATIFVVDMVKEAGTWLDKSLISLGGSTLTRAELSLLTPKFEPNL